MSVQYRKKTKENSNKSIEHQDDIKKTLSLTALKQKFEKNSNHAKWIA